MGLAFEVPGRPYGQRDSTARLTLASATAGRRDPSKKDLANAAKIVGIIGTVIFAGTVLCFGLFLLLPLIAILFGAAAETGALVQ